MLNFTNFQIKSCVDLILSDSEYSEIEDDLRIERENNSTEIESFISKIKCVTDKLILNEIFVTLCFDGEKSVEFTKGLNVRRVKVRGSFVKSIDVFNNPDNSEDKIIRKQIPKVSALASAHRGFQVGKQYQYGHYSHQGKVIKDPNLEYRPVVNLLMLKQMIEALENASKYRDLCKFFVQSYIQVNENLIAYQVMPYVDTSNKIFNQMLPNDCSRISVLVLNICDAACLANITMQADCTMENLCLIRDVEGENFDIRMFDYDILDAGQKDDWQEIFDFTNPQVFDVTDSVFHKIAPDTGICYDTRAALPPLISEKLFESFCAAQKGLQKIAVDYASYNNGKKATVPLMLKDEGLLDQWKERVMIVREDGRLYKTYQSTESIKFDHTVALFVLYKLGCSNNETSLFIFLSFKDLESKYCKTVSNRREAELMKFFHHFTSH